MAVRSNVRYELPRQRVWIVFGTILFCYVGLVFRLLWLQGREGVTLRAEAAARRRHKIELPTQRGSICANDGSPLAVSLYSGTLSFDPGALRADPNDVRQAERNERNLNKAILALAPMLNLSPEQLAATVGTARQNYQFHPHARGSPRYSDRARICRWSSPATFGAPRSPSPASACRTAAAATTPAARIRRRSSASWAKTASRSEGWKKRAANG